MRSRSAAGRDEAALGGRSAGCPEPFVVGHDELQGRTAPDIGANTFGAGGNQEISSVKALQTGVRQRVLVHGEALQRLAHALDREEADDLVQDTWLRVLAQPGQGDEPRAWLCGVLRNLWRMDRRATRRRIARETWASFPTPPVDGPDVELADAERRAQVGALLDALPRHLREVVRLRYFDGLSAAAIARREGIPAGTVRRRLKDALDRLRVGTPEHLRGGVVVLALPDGGATASAKLVAGGLVAMKVSTKAVAAGLLAMMAIAGAVAWREGEGAAMRSEGAGAMAVPHRGERDSPGAEEIADAPIARSAPMPMRADPDPRTPQRARRDSLLADIRAAREAYRRSVAASEAGAGFQDDDVDREYLRERMREDLVPSAHRCYNALLVKDPEQAGTIVLDFDIVADEHLGGVVERVDLGEGTDIDDEGMRECMQDAMYEMTFDPPKSGGRVQVTYPLVFEPG